MASQPLALQEGEQRILNPGFVSGSTIKPRIIWLGGPRCKICIIPEVFVHLSHGLLFGGFWGRPSTCTGSLIHEGIWFPPKNQLGKQYYLNIYIYHSSGLTHHLQTGHAIEFHLLLLVGVWAGRKRSSLLSWHSAYIFI